AMARPRAAAMARAARTTEPAMATGTPARRVPVALATARLDRTTAPATRAMAPVIRRRRRAAIRRLRRRAATLRLPAASQPPTTKLQHGLQPTRTFHKPRGCTPWAFFVGA